MISHRRVTISLSDGSVGSEMSAEEVRNGHDAISEGVFKEIVAPDGT